MIRTQIIDKICKAPKIIKLITKQRLKIKNLCLEKNYH